MNDKWYTVEQVSQMLKLHPKTVRRYITQGKLRASKVGKQYRIGGHDLSLFVGERGEFEPAAIEEEFPKIDVSAVVDIEVKDKDKVDRIESTIIAALNTKDPSYGNSTVNMQRTQDGKKLRIMLWGSIVFITTMLESISVLCESKEKKI